jgi:hypothetical protein
MSWALEKDRARLRFPLQGSRKPLAKGRSLLAFPPFPSSGIYSKEAEIYILFSRTWEQAFNLPLT